MVLVALSLIAGFFAGLSACLTYVVLIRTTDVKNGEAERKVLTNRLFVRSGDVPLFSQEMITGKEAEPTSPKLPVKLRTPYQRGLDDAKDQVKQESRGESLPPNIAANLKQGLESLKS